MKKYRKIAVIVIAVILIISGLFKSENDNIKYPNIALDNIPEYSGSPYVVINDNLPFFTEDEYTTNSYETYSDLDRLGRCGVVMASIGKDLMPEEEREAIGQVKPSGWHTVKYDWVDGKYLYNRCHLLGFQLTGENANERNLITGTRYLNVEGMLPFENMVADYIKETDNHVLMRVTPVFKEDNLVASGVLMEALSMEDNGNGICFNVYCYNVQPGVEINYASGISKKDENYTFKTEDYKNETSFILNTSSKKVHRKECSNIKSIKDKNKEIYYGNIDVLLENGYDTCNDCFK